MKAAFVVKWTAAVPGREKAAIAFGRDADDFFAKKAAETLITDPKWFFAPPARTCGSSKESTKSSWGFSVMPR